MIISSSKKYIFIHVPKTAGISIRELLTNKDNMPKMEAEYNYYFYRFLAHISAAKVKDGFKSVYDDYFKFAFIRNPYDRFVSMYFSGKNRGKSGALYLKKFDTFTSFIEGLINKKVREYFHYESLNYFLTDKDGKLLVDFVGKFENMENDFKVIAERLGIKGELPKCNVSQHKDYRGCYNSRTRKMIYNHFRKDFKMFGYEF